jgi:cytochrome c oxidase assembly factor CtaG
MFHGGTQRGPHPLCVLGLFTTMAHSGALGALLTFAPAPWYNAYAVHGPNGAIDALGDQQLGGLIMWVPGSFAYLIAGLYLAGRWLVRPRASARFR